jgi:CHAT domain-containing protein
VVLSAYNTIAGTKPGAEALSSLARAFFYAGARALVNLALTAQCRVIAL